MVGRPRGRKSSANSQQNNPEFFKIYLPEHNSKALCIPPAFLDNFKGKIEKKATLQNFQGKTWQVELEKLQGKLLIKKGWESFVSGNSLVRGEFLIFRYNGDSSFTVKVFGINGCKKDETTTTIHQLQVKVEQDVVSEETDDNHIGAYEKKHPKRSKVEERSQDDSMIDISERAVGLRNIQFAKIYDISTASVMFIPGGIIKAHSINTPKMNATETITLRNQRGVSQTVTIQQTSRGQVKLGSGWMEFCSKNKFGQGDECEFEIVLDERRKVKEINLLRISRKKTVTRNTRIR